MRDIIITKLAVVVGLKTQHAESLPKGLAGSGGCGRVEPPGYVEALAAFLRLRRRRFSAFQTARDKALGDYFQNGKEGER